MYVYMCMFAYECMYICMYEGMCVSMYLLIYVLCIYVCLCVCMYVYMYFFIYLLACSITLVISNTTCYLHLIFTIIVSSLLFDYFVCIYVCE